MSSPDRDDAADDDDLKEREKGDDEVINISVKEQKKAGKKMKRVRTGGNDKKRKVEGTTTTAASLPPRPSSASSLSTPPAVDSRATTPDSDDAPLPLSDLERQSRRVSFGRVNRSKSHKKSMKDLRRNEPTPQKSISTPDRGILRDSAKKRPRPYPSSKLSPMRSRAVDYF